MDYIEEYKELRSEIRFYMDMGHKISHFALLILAGVFVAGIQYEEPILFFLSSIIITILWINKIRCTIGVNRVATYIEKFIEPKSVDLNWETYSKLHPLHNNFLIKFFANATFPIIIAISAIKGILLLRGNPYVVIIIYAIYIIVISWISIYSYIISKGGRQQELTRWEIIISKINVNNNDEI